MKDLLKILEQFAGIGVETQFKLIISVVAIILVEVVRFAVLRIGLRHSPGPETTYRWNRVSRYVAFTVAILVVGRVWFQGFQSLITYLGLLSAGLAIALQDVLKNLAGWLFILWRRPFALGDRIQIGAHIGDVVDQRIFQFTLLEIGNWVKADQSTGRLIHIPNGRVFTEPTSNYYQGFSFTWSEIPVMVTFESNWKKAKSILARLAERHSAHLSDSAERRLREASQRYLIYNAVITPSVYTSVEDSGVVLTLRYLVEPRKRRATDQAVWEDILEDFAASGDIDFAYPTRRFFSNATEGKDDLKP